jgi:uncharacterized protein YkwD
MARIPLALAATILAAGACLLAGAGFSPAIAAPTGVRAAGHRHGKRHRLCPRVRGRRASFRAGSKPTGHRRSSERCAATRHHRRHSGSRAVSGTSSSQSSGSSAQQTHATGNDLPPLTFAQNGVCPDAGLMPSQSNAQLIRGATLCLINRERTTRGEHALTWSAALIASAQQHTQSMVVDGYFEHYGPDGQSPIARMRSTGYISSNVGYEVGENIAWGTEQGATPAAVVSAWMASAGHRANILNAAFRETGIGVSPALPASLSEGQPGSMYTQDFGVIIPA